MAGRRRSKSDSSTDLVVVILVLFAVGWAISHWEEILFLIVLVGIAAWIYLILKQFRKNLIEKKINTQASQQKIALAEPVQPTMPSHELPKWGMSKYELEKLDDATLDEIVVARLHATDRVNQRVEQQRFAALPMENDKELEFTPRPVFMNPEEIEAELQQLEKIVRG